MGVSDVGAGPDKSRFGLNFVRNMTGFIRNAAHEQQGNGMFYTEFGRKQMPIRRI
jgi:hypothetical protein